MSATRHAAAAAAFLLLAGCDKKLPGAPTQLTRGVTIYRDANFEGASALLTGDARNLGDYSGPCLRSSGTPGTYGFSYISDWKFCVSSLRIAPGWRATIYRDEDFKGESFEVTADVSNLQLVPGTCPNGGLNDCVASIRVGQQ